MSLRQNFVKWDPRDGEPSDAAGKVLYVIHVFPGGRGGGRLCSLREFMTKTGA